MSKTQNTPNIRNNLTKTQIYNTIKALAKSQGFYGRVLRALEEGGEEELNTRLDYLETLNFRDTTDLVLYFEC